MTRKRYLAVAGLVAVLASVGLGVAVIIELVLPTRPSATKWSFDCVEKRMTQEEVVAIFGKDADDVNIRTDIPSQILSEHLYWTGENGELVQIRFQDGIVTDRWWHKPTETVFDKLHRWLRL